MLTLTNSTTASPSPGAENTHQTDHVYGVCIDCRTIYHSEDMDYWRKEDEWVCFDCSDRRASTSPRTSDGPTEEFGFSAVSVSQILRPVIK